MYQAGVLLDFQGGRAEAELQLPAERLQSALGSERDSAAQYIARNFSATLADGRSFRIEFIEPTHPARIEGAPYVVARLRLTPPPGVGTELFDLHCSLLLDRIPSQVFLVSIRSDWRTGAFAGDPQLLGVLRGSERTLRVDRRSGSWLNGFSAVFRMGMRHIAEGSDHLLFLLALLLPAPLIARRGRWAGHSNVPQCLRKIAGIVTAFTLGHSVTLAAGALGMVRVPSRPIETLIAVSILVSAVHAFRPIFPGREAAIAGGFGLVHGMAFASALSDLGLGAWERAAGIFGFNLGIEAMQLVVVACALPPLMLLSRGALYPPIRAGGALFAGGAAAGWIAERLWNLPNPAGALVMGLAERAPWIALGFTVLGIAAWHSPGRKRSPL